MDSRALEDIKRRRRSLNLNESEGKVPRKRLKSSELEIDIEQIVLIYDFVEELQSKEKRFYRGIQTQLEQFHLSQQARYDDLMGDLDNIKLRLSVGRVPMSEYGDTSRRNSFSTDKSTLQNEHSSSESSSAKLEINTLKPLRKSRSPVKCRNKTKGPSTPAREASPTLSPPPPHSPSSQPPPLPPPPQSERPRRKLPKKDYELKTDIDVSDGRIRPLPREASDGEFIPPNPARRDPNDDHSPTTPTKLIKKEKPKSRKSIKGQRLLKEGSKGLEAISKSIGTPGIAKKGTVQRDLTSFWSNGIKGEEGQSPRKNAPPKRSALISPPLVFSPPPSSPSFAPQPSPTPQPVAKPTPKWRVEGSKAPVPAR